MKTYYLILLFISDARPQIVDITTMMSINDVAKSKYIIFLPLLKPIEIDVDF